MARAHHIFLIPGFFGFVNLGRLMYFSHVREYLERTFEARGRRVIIHQAHVPPTASLPVRTAAVAEFVADTAGGDDAPIHLIGHSTGGLDARLFVTPGVTLSSEHDVETLAGRVRSVVTVAGPHRGTPLASFFTSLMGQQLLRVLSLSTVAILRGGRLPASIVARIGAAFARAALPRGRVEVVFDHLEDELLGRLDADDQMSVSKFFHEVGNNQGLIPQLTPEGIDMFNATAVDRPGVGYGSVLTRARRPRLRNHLRLRKPMADRATYVLYSFLHRQTAAWSIRPTGLATPDQREAMRAEYGEMPAPSDSDGIVPTLSQPWGRVVHAATADHLDVIGHFDDERHDPPHHDWLETSSGFDRAKFERLWGAVAGFVGDHW